MPCVTVRENTERPVTITEGTNRLAGTSRAGILAAVADALYRRTAATPPRIVGDGHAAAHRRVLLDRIESAAQTETVHDIPSLRRTLRKIASREAVAVLSASAMSACRSPPPRARRFFHARLRHRCREDRGDRRRRSYIDAVESTELAALVNAGRLAATVDFARLADCDVIIICVPTPLSRQRDPDLRFVLSDGIRHCPHPAQGPARGSRIDDYPGTTDGDVKPVLEATGLRSGEDFFLAYSPEREDPATAAFTPRHSEDRGGRRGFRAGARPDVLRRPSSTGWCRYDPRHGGGGEDHREHLPCREHRNGERTQDHLRRHGIDVWEVIDGAATKPFGICPSIRPRPRRPCIPIDPFYLT